MPFVVPEFFNTHPRQAVPVDEATVAVSDAFFNNAAKAVEWFEIRSNAAAKETGSFRFNGALPCSEAEIEGAKLLREAFNEQISETGTEMVKRSGLDGGAYTVFSRKVSTFAPAVIETQIRRANITLERAFERVAEFQESQPICGSLTVGAAPAGKSYKDKPGTPAP